MQGAQKRECVLRAAVSPDAHRIPDWLKTSVAANWRETLGFLSNMPNAFGGADKTELFRV